MKILYLYSTSGCHLCDQAWDVLTRVVPQYPVRLEEVDVSESDELIERYGVRIPVLTFVDHSEELDWPFDVDKTNRFIQKYLL